MASRGGGGGGGAQNIQGAVANETLECDNMPNKEHSKHFVFLPASGTANIPQTVAIMKTGYRLQHLN